MKIILFRSPPNEKVLRFSVYSNSGVVFIWINIVCLPRLKIFGFFFWTLSVFFVDFRVTVRRTWSSPQNSSYIYKYFFFGFLYSYIQSICKSRFHRFTLKCGSVLLLNITVNEELELVFFCKIKTVNLLKIWAYIIMTQRLNSER